MDDLNLRDLDEWIQKPGWEDFDKHDDFERTVYEWATKEDDDFDAAYESARDEMIGGGDDT